MHRGKLIALLLVVGALAALLWWRRAETPVPIEGSSRALFAGVDVQRIVALRIDHRLRATQLRLERDEQREWRITDPFPGERAEEGLAEQLLQLIAQARAYELPSADRAQLALDPPRALLEVVERVGSELRSTRLLIGAPDVDGQGLHVELDGRVLRTARGLDTLLDRSLDDYRSRRALAIDPTEVRVLRRRLRDAPAGDGLDGALGNLEAEVEPGRWVLREPCVARLDPLLYSALLRTLAGLHIDKFVDDQLGDPARYGLERPELSFELVLRDGRELRLLLARPAGEQPAREEDREWLGMLAGGRQVWRFQQRSCHALLIPASDLIDRRIARLLRSDVERVRIEGGAEPIELARAPKGWFLGELSAGVRADDGKIEDLLNALEGAESARLTRSPPESAAPLRVRIQGAAAADETLEIGAPERLDLGDGRWVRRAGEEVWGWVPLAALAPCLAEPIAFRSLVVHKLVELEQSRLVLRRGERVRSYDLVVEPSSLRWCASGTKVEARELVDIVERLLSIKALRWLEGEASQAPLADPVEVEIVPKLGEPLRFALGIDAQGRCEIQEGARRAEIAPGLHDALRALLAK